MSIRISLPHKKIHLTNGLKNHVSRTYKTSNGKIHNIKNDSNKNIRTDLHSLVIGTSRYHDKRVKDLLWTKYWKPYMHLRNKHVRKSRRHYRNWYKLHKNPTDVAILRANNHSDLNKVIGILKKNYPNQSRKQLYFRYAKALNRATKNFVLGHNKKYGKYVYIYAYNTNPDEIGKFRNGKYLTGGGFHAHLGLFALGRRKGKPSASMTLAVQQLTHIRNYRKTMSKFQILESTLFKKNIQIELKKSFPAVQSFRNIELMRGRGHHITLNMDEYKKSKKINDERIKDINHQQILNELKKQKLKDLRAKHRIKRNREYAKARYTSTKFKNSLASSYGALAGSMAGSHEASVAVSASNFYESSALNSIKSASIINYNNSMDVYNKSLSVDYKSSSVDTLMSKATSEISNVHEFLDDAKARALTYWQNYANRARHTISEAWDNDIKPHLDKWFSSKSSSISSLDLARKRSSLRPTVTNSQATAMALAYYELSNSSELNNFRRNGRGHNLSR